MNPLLLAAALSSVGMAQDAPADAAPAQEELAQLESESATSPEKPAAGYVVGSRDVLEIVVFEEEALSGDYVVSEDGLLDFPLVGRLEVDGLSPSQVDDLLTERLAADFLVSPQVKVQVGAFASKPVRILGAIKKPGVYPLSGPTSVLELIARAGGMSADGVAEVRINRKGQAETLVIRLDQVGVDETELMLVEGDTVQVPPPKVVYVTGEVEKAGSVPFGDGITISQAIILAGGPKATASLRKVWIKRGDEQIRVNLKRVYKGRETDVVLQPDDQVLVSESVL